MPKQEVQESIPEKEMTQDEMLKDPDLQDLKEGWWIRYKLPEPTYLRKDVLAALLASGFLVSVCLRTVNIYRPATKK